MVENAKPNNNKQDSSKQDSNKAKALVIGASGFLGSHLVRELIQQGYSVRILVRATSNITMLQGLDVEKCIGDVLDVESLGKAMQGCCYVFHSAVNTKAWLLDSAPLYETNVIGVQNTIAAAKKINSIEKFVLTSSIATIGRSTRGFSDESHKLCAKDRLAPYVRTRELGENAVLDAAINDGLAAVACCVANTYGEYDVQPTPHGKFLHVVAKGWLPVYFDAASECVGVKDAAKALILAAEKGRSGERYIISEGFVHNRDLLAMAAKAAGVKVAKWQCPTWALYLLAVPTEAIARLLGLNPKFCRHSIKLLTDTWPMSHAKAQEELGWQPEPLEKSVKEAVAYYLKK